MSRAQSPVQRTGRGVGGGERAAGLGLEGTHLGHQGCSEASLVLVAGGDSPWS